MPVSCFLKLLTWNVVIVSVAMFALGVANLTVWCSGDGNPCTSSSNLALFSTASSVYFLAIGILGAIPCLVSGIGTLRSFSKPSAGKDWLWLLVAVSALVVTPVMILFSAFNATTAMTAINNMPAGTVTTGMTVAFALPLTIAILAFLVHLHLLLIWCARCQADDEVKERVTVVEVPPQVVQQPVPIAQPVLRSSAWHVSAPPSAQCCNHYGQVVYGR